MTETAAATEEHPLTDVRFETLDLEPSLMKGLGDAGFEFCTPIQAGALPKALAGTDVEGQAQTGTGKTCAFLLATMNLLLRKPALSGGKEGDPRAIILAPTRELAVQIHADAEILGRHTGLRICVVFGGTGYDSQRQQLLKGVDILIGTPGRMIDYFKQNIFSLKRVQVTVLDEADRMFDLGFIRDIRYVLRRMPPPEQRLNMLFSATLSHRVSELAYEHMNAPIIVDANPDRVTVKKVDQQVYHVSKDDKISLLHGLLSRMDVSRTLVFANTKRTCERVADYLEGNGYKCGLLTGDVPQKQRLSLLNQFKRGELPILVATDVAARGLHIPDVSHVINFDLPQDGEDYVHRVGRTARAGASGNAISLACEEFVYSLDEIEDFIGQKISSEIAPESLLAELKPPARRRRHSGRPRGAGSSGGRGRPRSRSRN
ncbi:MAG: DEAD/DEAH box helicase [Gammaproteobacteria bacterium]|nr:DEAD/DEAH box helicase [Gammaproteobacteria bacterium]MDH3411443.1 DEAD/DEAH box helicase [Gammaproteobacteria bacterium]